MATNLSVGKRCDGLLRVRRPSRRWRRRNAQQTRDRIFYSWQSDLPNPTNRGFIQKALESAAKRIRDDESIVVEPVVDRDTQGVAGSPDIASIIFGKIESASVFVADVTSILAAVGPRALGRWLEWLGISPPSRSVPNPNVLIELGFAAAHLSWDRVILVTNLAHGSIESLPFDLRQRRILAFRTDGPDGRPQLRAELSRRLEAELRTMLVLPPETQGHESAVGEPKEHPAERKPKPNDIDHIYFSWDVMVSQRNAENPDATHRALRHCTVRIVSESLRRPPPQPRDDQNFLTEVRDAFDESRYAELEDVDTRGTRVRHTGQELRFDRTWAWGNAGEWGVFGMAVTLPMPDNPKLYSLGDLVSDVSRFLDLGAKKLDARPATIWLELEASELAYVMPPSEAWRLQQVAGQLSKLGTNETGFVEKELDSGKLLEGRGVAIAAEMLQIAIARVHKERIERATLIALPAARAGVP